MDVLLTAMAVLFIVLWLVNKAGRLLGRNTARIANRNRCAACGARLRHQGWGYAPRCAHCGAEQPWAQHHA